MRTLIKLALLLVIGLLAYNYFLGTPDEQQQSRVILGKAKELGGEAWDLLRSERSKMKEGKYDGALDRLEALYASLKEQAEAMGDSDALGELGRLSKRRVTLEEQLNDGTVSTKLTRVELDRLTSETEALMHEMEAKSRTAAPY